MVGVYKVRSARTVQDFARVMALRRGRFGVGEDPFDETAAQIMIEDASGLLGAFRLTDFANGTHMPRSYSAQFYDLSAFRSAVQPALELGRICLAAEAAGREADVLRLAFAAMAARVDATNAALLFGCASFDGSDPAPHIPSLGLLRAHIAAPWPIGRLGRDCVDLTQISAPSDRQAALRGLPPLLRSYLAIGGWVGDHAVRDFDLGTIHVFTGVEVARIPPARARVLRALAAQMELDYPSPQSRG